MGRMGKGAWLAAVGVLTLSQAAEASPQDLFGFGPGPMAWSGGGAAAALGSEATWANPALLSRSHQRTLTLGLVGAKPSLKLATGGGAASPLPAANLQGNLIGAVLPLPFEGALKDRVTLGLGFFTPTDVVVRARVLFPDTPQFATLADRMQTVTIQGGLGLDLGYGFRAGAGFSTLAGITGTVVVATDASGATGTAVDDQLVASYGAVLGLSYEPNEHWRVGLTYRQKLQADFNIQVEVYDLGSLEVPPFNIGGLAQFDPSQVQAEVAYADEGYLAGAGCTYKDWSAYPGPQSPTVVCPPELLDCAALRPNPAGFSDTFVPRIFGQLPLIRRKQLFAALRAGYAYEKSPAPAQSGRENAFDNDRHWFSLGYQLKFGKGPGALRLDAVAQWHQLVSRDHVKTDSGQTFTSSGHVIVTAISAGVEF